MLVTQDLMPGGWLIAGNAALATVLLLVALRAPWGRLASNETQHSLLGGCVALVVLWSLSAGLHPGLSFHFSGVTALTLVVGWRLATLASLPVMVGLAMTGSGGWDAIGVNALVLFVLPATLTSLIHRFVQRRLPLNFFVYVFVTVHFGSMVVVATAVMAICSVYVITDVYSAGVIARDFLPFVPMMLLSEGFINGLVIAVLVATRPGCVTTFDDRLYLYKR